MNHGKVPIGIWFQIPNSYLVPLCLSLSEHVSCLSLGRVWYRSFKCKNNNSDPLQWRLWSLVLLEEIQTGGKSPLAWHQNSDWGSGVKKFQIKWRKVIRTLRSVQKSFWCKLSVFRPPSRQVVRRNENVGQPAFWTVWSNFYKTFQYLQDFNWKLSCSWN